MKPYQLLLSIVLVTKNDTGSAESILREIGEVVAGLVTDYELIVVDNASEDATVDTLRKLVDENGLPNLQIYVLSSEVDRDTANWAGVENSLGDYVLIIDPRSADIRFLEKMLEKAVEGSDVVFANNASQPDSSLTYRILSAGFRRLYRWLSGSAAKYHTSQYRLLSKRVVNFILQHPMPVLTYRFLPATFGFSRAVLTYSYKSKLRQKRKLSDSIDQGMRLLVSTTRAPMRLVTTVCLLGAVLNVLYSIYVLTVAIFVNNLAPGWVTLSLQHAGMFLLLSIAIMVLAEYILHMTSLANSGPAYHVAQEYTSALLSRRTKLNIETVSTGESQ